jgi:hypothetical protein
MEPNPHRGEVRVELSRPDGSATDEFALRPTFAAISAVEETLGTGLADIMRRFGQPPTFGLRDILAIIYCCLSTSGNRERRDVIAERILMTGLARLVDPCSQWCVNAWLGGQDPTISPPTAKERSTAGTDATPSANGSGSPAAN